MTHHCEREGQEIVSTEMIPPPLDAPAPPPPAPRVDLERYDIGYYDEPVSDEVLAAYRAGVAAADHDWSEWVDRPTSLPAGRVQRLRWCRECNLYESAPPRDEYRSEAS
jgi:hypothetical protein